MGECPDWFAVLTAARWMGVAPWDLSRQPVGWTDAALAAMAAEQHAREVAQRETR